MYNVLPASPNFSLQEMLTPASYFLQPASGQPREAEETEPSQARGFQVQLQYVPKRSFP
jgi:hypothetical protein